MGGRWWEGGQEDLGAEQKMETVGIEYILETFVQEGQRPVGLNNKLGGRGLFAFLKESCLKSDLELRLPSSVFISTVTAMV